MTPKPPDFGDWTLAEIEMEIASLESDDGSWAAGKHWKEAKERARAKLKALRRARKKLITKP